MNTSEFPNYSAWLDKLKVADQGVIVVLWVAFIAILFLINWKVLAGSRPRIARLGLLAFYGSMAALWLFKTF